MGMLTTRRRSLNRRPSPPYKLALALGSARLCFETAGPWADSARLTQLRIQLLTVLLRQSVSRRGNQFALHPDAIDRAKVGEGTARVRSPQDCNWGAICACDVAG